MTTVDIDPVFLGSPLLAGTGLDELLGCRLLLKVETLNPVRSFKGRGTSALLRARAFDAPVVCASAGNFGQGIAYAARSLNHPVHVYAATGANPLKVEAMRRLGATVHLSGRDVDEAKEIARREAGERQWTFVEDGHEPELATGAGTMAEEVLAAGHRPDVAVVPVGNGSLISGVGAALKAALPTAQVVGVCAEGAPAMALSFSSGRAISTPGVDTVADGLAVREPVPVALDTMRGAVDEMVTVSDDGLVEACRLLLRSTGLVVEPAGAAGLAWLLGNRDRFSGRTVLTPLCGGNVTSEFLTQLV